MTSYEVAELLRKLLRQQGMGETWIVAWGVDIQYRRHQRKRLCAILKALESELAWTTITITLIERHKRNTLMTLNRHTMEVSYK